eukprot:COSAG01_NODE_33754_length_559_cov_0.969565_1_plen_145_part_10
MVRARTLYGGRAAVGRRPRGSCLAGGWAWPPPSVVMLLMTATWAVMLLGQRAYSSASTAVIRPPPPSPPPSSTIIITPLPKCFELRPTHDHGAASTLPRVNAASVARARSDDAFSTRWLAHAVASACDGGDGGGDGSGGSADIAL